MVLFNTKCKTIAHSIPAFFQKWPSLNTIKSLVFMIFQQVVNFNFSHLSFSQFNFHHFNVSRFNLAHLNLTYFNFPLSFSSLLFFSSIPSFSTLLVFFSTLFTFIPLKAETMFEGYYKIRLGGVPAGFIVQKYEFDNKKKQFFSTYYIKTNALAGNITESLKAVCNDKFEPVTYQYTSKTGESIKTIDATFKGNRMKALVSDGKMGNKIDREIPSGTFLSTFLAYMMLSRGISNNKVYSYAAIAEEDGNVYNGKAMIQDTSKEFPFPTYKVLNEFKGTKFVSMMSEKGEVLGTKSPVQNIETELVKIPAEATHGFQIDTKSLRLLFGSIPTGKVNELGKSPIPQNDETSSNSNKPGIQHKQKDGAGLKLNKDSPDKRTDIKTKSESIIGSKGNPSSINKDSKTSTNERSKVQTMGPNDLSGDE